MQWLIHLLFGHYQGVLTRRVSDEETVQLSFYSRNPVTMQLTLAKMLSQLRDHMIAYNQEVILAHRSTITTLTQKIEQQTIQLSALNHHVQEAEGKVQGFGAAGGHQRIVVPMDQAKKAK